jgi:hypothetical protein
MLVATAAVAAAATAGTVLSGGTYALWSDSASLGAGVVTTGDSRLVLTGALATASFRNLLPGDRVAQQLTIANAGAVALDVNAATASPSDRFAVRLALDASACGVAPLAGAPLSPVPSALGALEPGRSAPLCVEVTALAAVLPGDALDAQIALEGVQR